MTTKTSPRQQNLLWPSNTVSMKSEVRGYSRKYAPGCGIMLIPISAMFCCGIEATGTSVVGNLAVQNNSEIMIVMRITRFN